MKRGRLAAGLAVFLVLALAAALVVPVLPGSRAQSPNDNLAPTFSLTTIYGSSFTLSDYRNHSAVLLLFTALSCSACALVEKSLKPIYASYNSTGTSRLTILSVYVEPQFGDTIPALQNYHQSQGITWQIAQDTNALTVYNDYHISELPTVVIVDEAGHATYDQSGVLSDAQLQHGITDALSGHAAPISIVAVSVFALAAVAGISTFFSPCAFPMFPGYMSLFLGLNAKGADSPTALSGSYKCAARKALVAGSVTAFGMVIVFLIIGIALFFAATLIAKYIPDLLIVVGALLIALGALLFTNLQYWKIVTPIQNLWGRMRGKSPDASAASVTPSADAPTKGLYLKLFSYGMGYAAAAAGCVAPVILGAIVSGLALSVFAGVLNILIYTATAALLMIGVTVMLALAGRRFVNQLKAYTPVIKKISASVLVVVGIYLVYYYYLAWVK